MTLLRAAALLVALAKAKHRTLLAPNSSETSLLNAFLAKAAGCDASRSGAPDAAATLRFIDAARAATPFAARAAAIRAGRGQLVFRHFRKVRGGVERPRRRFSRRSSPLAPALRPRHG